MKTIETITKIIIGITFAVWIAWDVYLAKNHLPTESMTITGMAHQYTFFSFIMGFLNGHWFYTRQQPWASGWMFAIPIFLILAAWDYYWNLKGYGLTPYRSPAIFFSAGIVFGTLMWSQGNGASILP